MFQIRVVLSFGSNNQWMFEESIKNKTKCSIYTFDCTVSHATPPPGVNFYPYCIDAMSYTNGQGMVFKSIQDIVDRIGGGDAFMAGYIYGELIYQNTQKAIEFGVAASGLKHTIEGDFNIASVAEIEAVMNGDVSGKIRR